MFLRAESKSPEVGKIKDELFMPQEKLFFPRSDRCQPRSEGCPAEAGGRGWTFRPRLTPVRPRKEELLSRHGVSLRFFQFQDLLDSALRIHFPFQ